MIMKKEGSDEMALTGPGTRERWGYIRVVCVCVCVCVCVLGMDERGEREGTEKEI